MKCNSNIKEKVYSTPFIDVHEHLIEESRRLAGPSEADPLLPCDDWAYLLHHYAQDDLAVAGMPENEIAQFFSLDVSPEDKWALVSPYWERIRFTGYGRAVCLTLRRMFDEEDIAVDNVGRITQKMRANVQRGFYETVLQDLAGVELCHVNSSEHIFCETEYPSLLYQDLSTVCLSSGLSVPYLEEITGLPARTLQEYREVIDWCFDRYARQAVAVKNQYAYHRRLDYADVPLEEAEVLFERCVDKQQMLSRKELKALQNYLWRYCVRRATEVDLPVKLHTGSYGGRNEMPLARVSMNLRDLCPILKDFPTTRFVLMHMAYPYQDELLALAKHYSNVYVDLSWAWIINPAATVRFVKEFLVTVPWNKLLVFGGDYHCVENVVGHAEIARRGLTQALSEVVAEGWIDETEALFLAGRLMRDNAWEVFNMDEKSKVARQLSREVEHA